MQWLDLLSGFPIVEHLIANVAIMNNVALNMVVHKFFSLSLLIY